MLCVFKITEPGSLVYFLGLARSVYHLSLRSLPPPIGRLRGKWVYEKHKLDGRLWEDNLAGEGRSIRRKPGEEAKKSGF